MWVLSQITLMVIFGVTMALELLVTIHLERISTTEAGEMAEGMASNSVLNHETGREQSR